MFTNTFVLLFLYSRTTTADNIHKQQPKGEWEDNDCRLHYQQAN